MIQKYNYIIINNIYNIIKVVVLLVFVVKPLFFCRSPLVVAWRKNPDRDIYEKFICLVNGQRPTNNKTYKPTDIFNAKYLRNNFIISNLHTNFTLFFCAL